MDSYELERSKGKYNNMKENVNKMLNILSSSDAVDNLTRARSYLREYYFVDNVAFNSSELSSEKTELSETISDLKRIIGSIDSKISSISSDIEEAKKQEQEESES